MTVSNERRTSVNVVEKGNAEDPVPTRSRTLLLSVILFVLVSWLGFALLLYWTTRADDQLLTRAGQYGDSFGVLNVLFGGLALVGVAVAIMLQSRELSLQRQELIDTRRELESTRKAQEAQARHLEFQLQVTMQREKRDLCLKMLDRWTNPHMRASRLSSWDYLECRYGPNLESANVTVNLAEFRSQDSSTFDKFSDVCQFFSDLNKMLSEDLIDRELSAILFRDSVLPWFRYIDRLQFSEYTIATSDERRSYVTGVEHWYRHRVMTLKRWLEDGQVPRSTESLMA